jgi:hypothetical protein
MISGATQSSFKFLFQHFNVPENVIIHFNPNELLSSNKNIKILWAHYNCDQPLYQNVNWDKITHIVCVSDWEKQQFIKYLKISEDKITVIRNGGAEYFQPNKNKSKTLIYTSTPYRGLEYLPYIFTKVLIKHPDAKLKVFSGMELYGLPDNYDELYSILKNIPNVEVYKPIEHEKLVEHYQDAAIFCYPNVWEETSCVSLIESMRCGCYPILSDIGALRETSMGFGSLIKMNGKNTPSGWKPTKEFFDEFTNEVIRILDNYKYDEKISNFACNYYDWKIIAEKWVKLVERLLQKEKNMSYDITELVEMPTSKIVSDSEVLKKVYEDVFKWENYDKEHAQGRTNFQIEKFIALDNFTIASSFTALLKNRRIMAEGLFTKIIEMKERQREFDIKWENTPKDKPLDNGGSYSWYDLDSLKLENYLRSSELEIRDRVQQIEFFDKLLDKLIEMNGGPITKEQFEEEDHIYWERRFANQAYDELLSQQTGISMGNLHSIRRATAPTLVSNDVNRIKNPYPELTKLMSDDKGKQEFILGLQQKVIEGIGEVTGIDTKKLANENVADRISLPNKVEEQHTISPKSLFNKQHVSG